MHASKCLVITTVYEVTRGGPFSTYIQVRQMLNHGLHKMVYSHGTLTQVCIVSDDCEWPTTPHLSSHLLCEWGKGKNEFIRQDEQTGSSLVTSCDKLPQKQESRIASSHIGELLLFHAHFHKSWTLTNVKCISRFRSVSKDLQAILVNFVNDISIFFYLLKSNKYK